MKIALFVDVEPHEVAEARRRMRVLEFAANDFVFAEGDPTPGLLYIQEGRVEVTRQGVVLDTSGPGEIVGEMSLFTGRPRAATVRALEPCKVLSLDNAAFEQLRSAGNEVIGNLERAVLEQLGQRLRRLDEQIAEHSKEGVTNPYAKPAPSVFARIRSLFGTSDAPAAPVKPRELDAGEVLRLSPIFAREPATVLATVAMTLEHEAYPRGHVLCSQGEPGNKLFILALGHVDVFVARPTAADPNEILPLGTLGPGTAFGLTALMDDRPRIASVVASEPVDVLTLDRARWKRYLKESSRGASAFRAAMIRAFSDQVNDAGSVFVKTQKGATAELTRAAARLEHSATSETE